MTTARSLIIDRRRREALAGDRFIKRLLRLDRNRAALHPLWAVFRNPRPRRAA